jgi:hypothetical protein
MILAGVGIEEAHNLLGACGIQRPGDVARIVDGAL